MFVMQSYHQEECFLNFQILAYHVGKLWTKKSIQNIWNLTHTVFNSMMFIGLVHSKPKEDCVDQEKWDNVRSIVTEKVFSAVEEMEECRRISRVVQSRLALEEAIAISCKVVGSLCVQHQASALMVRVEKLQAETDSPRVRQILADLCDKIVGETHSSNIDGSPIIIE